jgi:uncharacterized membrane protein YfcA
VTLPCATPLAALGGHASVLSLVWAVRLPARALPAAQLPSSDTWWLVPSTLFAVTFLIGMVSVLSGLGGGTLFVPIIGSFFPFHLDFVRAAGLLVALSGALAAGPKLLRKNLADLRLGMPAALVASAAAIVGARLGLLLPTAGLQIALGFILLGLLVVIVVMRHANFPKVPAGDALSRRLGIMGAYYEESLGTEVEWRVHRTWVGLALFVPIGLMAGMFGIGAGWANVPVLNLVMGAPLKVAVGTSVLILAITPSAAWVYLEQGAVLPILVVPSIAGMMLGSHVGVRLLERTKPWIVRRVMIAILLVAGVRSVLKGLGVWP